MHAVLQHDPLFIGFPAKIYVFATRIYDYLQNNFPAKYQEATALCVSLLVVLLALVLLPALATVTAGEGVPASRIVFYLLVTLAKVSVFVAAAEELAVLARNPKAPCTSDGASALATQRLIESVAITAGYG